MKRKNSGPRSTTPYILSLVVLLFAGQLSAQSFMERKAELAPGALYVKFERGVAFNAGGLRTGLPAVDAILARELVELIHAVKRDPAPLNKGEMKPEEEIIRRIVRIEYQSGTDPEALAAELADIAEIEIAEPIEVCYPDYTPNDTYVAQQWAIAMMQLEQAWEITKGDPGIIIGIVDTGVQWDHPDLAANIYINPGEWGTNGELSNNGIDDDGNGYIDDYHGWDFGNDDNNPMDRPETIEGMITYHGTGVAGCAGAVTDNDKGVASSGFNCSILPIKAAVDDQGGNSKGYEGMIYGADMGCHVINNSWGGSRFGSIQQDMVNYAWSKGSLVVGSSGNDPVNHDITPHFPSDYRHVFSVGSQDPDGKPSGYATFGASVDILAPGWVIRTTEFNSTYQVTQGTSFSAPILSGMAGLLFAKNPTWTNDQVAKQMRVTSSKFETPRNPLYYGYANAYRALTENQNLDEIPGIIISRFEFQPESGKRIFTVPGEKATVRVTFKNVLAATSPNAAVSLTFDDAGQLTATPSSFTLGELQTNDTIEVTFEIELAQDVKVAEGLLPVRFTITDGEYVDYLIERFDILIDDAWRTKYTADDKLPGDARFTAIDVVSDRYIWAVARSARGNYCRRSINSGTTWSESDGSGYPSSREVLCIFGIDAGKAVLGTGGTTSAIVYRTTNSGVDWIGEPITSITGSVNGIHMYDANNGILAGNPKSGRWGIARTTNGGAKWAMIPTPVPSPNDSIAGWSNSFEVYLDNVWFGTNQGWVYHSTDRGQTWNNYNSLGLNAADISFRDELTGAVRFNEFMRSDSVVTGEYGIGITKDGGKTWSLLNTIQLTTPGFVKMERLGKRMWAINWDNVFSSSDLGQTWKTDAVPRGFDSVHSADIYTSPTPNGRTVVYAGNRNLVTYSSAWQPSPVSVIPAPIRADAFEVGTLYPNPVSGTMGNTTVAFELPVAARTQIDVYDAAGCLVRNAMSAVLEAGGHSFSIRTDGLPAGVFFIRVTHGGNAVTRMLTVTQ